MKIYYYLNTSQFSNCYLAVNEAVQEAVLIDPGETTEELISQIEDNKLKLSAVLITHNHEGHSGGLKTLQKIYSPKIYAADWDIASNYTTVLGGDGRLKLAKMLVHYMSIPGHTSDSIVFSIGNVIFTGDVLFAGSIGSTNSSYSEFILRSNIETKLFSQQGSIILMPGHGPPTTLEAARQFYPSQS